MLLIQRKKINAKLQNLIKYRLPALNQRVLDQTDLEKSELFGLTM